MANKLHFSVLELTVESETDSLRDDGFVKDVREHAERIAREECDKQDYQEFSRQQPRACFGAL